MRIEVKVPGSCGELIQGKWRGKSFLVTCPVDIYATAVVTDEHEHFCGLGQKSLQAARLALEYLGHRHFPYGLELLSDLPVGKGMAASSADVVAVLLAVSAGFGHPFRAKELAELATQIEPTDGTFFPGIVRMDSMTGQCFEHWTDIPRLAIAVFDTGGMVDTVAFHQRKDLAMLEAAKEAEICRALRCLRETPLTAGRIAEAASISALANQSILPKKSLEQIVEAARAEGALGIDIAHSGTVIGALFAPEAQEETIEAAAAHLTAQFPHLAYLRTVRMISGGFTIRYEGKDA